jgi:hypothetical protein
MANTYRALSPAAEAAFAKGVFEATYTASQEQDHLGSGLIELVPRTYRALSNNYAAAEQGQTFEAALLVEHEAALIQGGHIERVDKPATKQKKED